MRQTRMPSTPTMGMVQMISLIMSAQVLTSSALALCGLRWMVPTGPSVSANQ